jgi:hypothetical protein
MSLLTIGVGFIWIVGASQGTQANGPVIDGEFELLPAVLPEGFRHSTGVVYGDEFIWFGGLGNAGPGPMTPVNHDVQTLDVDDPTAWQYRSTDAVVPLPWFTTTRGLVEVDSGLYLACEDTDFDHVFAFDPETYQFSHVSSSPFAPAQQAGDCCAVGVNIPNNRGQDKGEERIYLIGGRNDYENPTDLVRYYSITHDEWVIVDSLHEGRSHLGCAGSEHQGENTLYAISGGNSPQGTVRRSMETYNAQADEWTIYEDYFAEGEGRTRFGVQNIANKYLMLIGGDPACAGGSVCASQQPLTTVDLIDIRHGNNLISHLDYDIPQLTTGRQSPATGIRFKQGNNQSAKYMLYVVAGRNRIPMGGLQVLTSSEVLAFDRIRRNALHH